MFVRRTETCFNYAFFFYKLLVLVSPVLVKVRKISQTKSLGKTVLGFWYRNSEREARINSLYRHLMCHT
jgi:hypothetical protein